MQLIICHFPGMIYFTFLLLAQSLLRYCRFSESSSPSIRAELYIAVRLQVNNRKYLVGRGFNPYNGIINNDKKMYIPARTTTLGYEKTK